jgi:hypothetical protein
VWPGAINANDTTFNITALNGTSVGNTTNTTFASGVHSLTLGRANGGIHDVSHLPEPIDITFEVELPGTNNNSTDGGEIYFQASCLYWDTDAGEWSDAGCVLKSQVGTTVVCSCTHLTDFATAFAATAASADFSALTNFSLFTIDNILANPLPFVVMFSLYFLAGMGCILGTNVDSASKELSSRRIVHMHQFRAFKEVPRKPSNKTRMIRAFFLTSNICMVMLSLGILFVGANNFESTFNWIFGDLGNFGLMSYACFQLLMTVIGPFIIGMFKGFGAYRPLFTLWLVLGISFFIMNFLALEFVQREKIIVPGSLCVGVDTTYCERDVFYIFQTFWNSTETEVREKVLNVLPLNTTCSEAVEVPMTRECAYDLFAQFNGYLLFMGMSHIILLCLLVPSGVISYTQWSSWRKRNKHMVPLTKDDLLKEAAEAKAEAENAKVESKVLNQAPSKVLDKKEVEGQAALLVQKVRNDKNTPKTVKFKLAMGFAANAGLSAIAAQHKLLSIYFTTKVHFPRADRVLCLLAFVLSELFVVGLFRSSPVIQPSWGCATNVRGDELTASMDLEADFCALNCGNSTYVQGYCGADQEMPCYCDTDAALSLKSANDMEADDVCDCMESPPELVFVISHAILVALFSSIPVAVMFVLFQTGYKKLLKADELSIATKTTRLAMKLAHFRWVNEWNSLVSCFVFVVIVFMNELHYCCVILFLVVLCIYEHTPYYL